MEKYFTAWLIVWTLITIGVIFYLKKKNRKRDLTKFTIVAGLIMAGALGIIVFFAMKIQIADLLH